MRVFVVDADGLSSESYERILGAKPTDLGLEALVRRSVREELAADRREEGRKNWVALYQMWRSMVGRD